MNLDLESANDKLDDSINNFKEVTLTRFECQALCDDYNEQIEQIDKLKAEIHRTEWVYIFLFFLGYWLLWEVLRLTDRYG